MTNANLTTLQGLTNAFNASQSNVKVNLVGQNSYTDTLTAYTTALSDPSKLPDLVQWETELIQLLIDSQSIVSVASAMAVDHAFSTKDFVPSMLNFFKVNGTQWALPFNISCQVVYYNETAFTKAGLDPSNPPTTLPKMHAAAAKIVRDGDGQVRDELEARQHRLRAVDGPRGRTSSTRTTAAPAVPPRSPSTTPSAGRSSVGGRTC